MSAPHGSDPRACRVNCSTLCRDRNVNSSIRSNRISRRCGDADGSSSSRLKSRVRGEIARVIRYGERAAFVREYREICIITRTIAPSFECPIDEYTKR